MADNGKKFDIEIGTKADTAGLERVKRELEAVEQAGKEAVNPMADGSMLRAAEDTERATAATKSWAEAAAANSTAAEAHVDAIQDVAEAVEDIEPAAKKADDGFKKLFDQQRVQGIGQQLAKLANTVGTFAREFEKTESGQEFFSGLSEEVKVFGETAFAIGNGVAQGYAQGGPIGAAIGGLTELVDKLSGGWLEMNARVKAAEADLEQAILANNARIRERKLEAAGAQIEQTYRKETAELDRQLEALARIAGIRAEQAKLDKAKDQLADTRAAGAGKPQAAINIENVGQEFQARQTALAAQLADARAALQIDAAKLFSATDAYLAEVDRVGTKAADKSKEAREREAAISKIDIAERNIVALEEKLNIQAETFAVEAETELEQQKQKLLGSLEASAASLEDSLQQGIDQAGGNASTAAKDALAQVQRITEDGAVTAEEVNALLAAVQRLQGSTEAKDRRTADAIAEIVQNGEVYNSTLEQVTRTLKSQATVIAEQAAEIRAINARMDGIRAELR